MPFIDSKITLSLSEDKKEEVKVRLGQAVSLIGKTENYLMVGFEDNYDLYLGGKKLDAGAFVSVSMYGSASSSAYDSMTAEICRIYDEVLNIPAKNIYVTYTGIPDWGWNGRNF